MTRVAYGFEDESELGDWHYLSKGRSGRCELKEGRWYPTHKWPLLLNRLQWIRLNRLDVTVSVVESLRNANSGRFTLFPQGDAYPTDTYSVTSAGANSALSVAWLLPSGSTDLGEAQASWEGEQSLKLRVDLGETQLRVRGGGVDLTTPADRSWRIPGGGTSVRLYRGTALEEVILIGQPSERPQPKEQTFDPARLGLREVPLNTLVDSVTDGRGGEATCEDSSINFRIRSKTRWEHRHVHPAMVRLLPTRAPFEVTARFEGAFPVGACGIAVLRDDGKYLRYPGVCVRGDSRIDGWVGALSDRRIGAVGPWFLRVRRLENRYWFDRSVDGKTWTPEIPGPVLMNGETVIPAFYAVVETKVEGERAEIRKWRQIQADAQPTRFRVSEIRIRVGREP